MDDNLKKTRSLKKQTVIEEDINKVKDQTACLMPAREKNSGENERRRL